MPGADQERELEAHVRRDDSGWFAWVDGLEGAVGSSRRLEEAVTQAEGRAAAALSAAIDELRISWQYELGAGELDAVQEYRHYQGALADAQLEYNAALHRAIRQLNQSGYTDRDAAFLLGLSHQRIAQVRTRQAAPKQT
jgi:hypothetical protein